MNKRPLLCLCLLSSPLDAGTVIADFNDNTTGPLGAFIVGDGQEGGSGWLTGDVWANTGTIAVIPGDLTAPPATGYAVIQDPTSQSVQGTSTAPRHTTRAVEEPMTGTVWFSFLLNQPTVQSRGGISFNQNGTSPGNPRIVATGTEIRLGLGPTLQPGGGGADLLAIGETALILGRLTIDNTGLAETLDIWVNPDVSVGSSSLPAPGNSLSEETTSLNPGILRVGIQSYSADGLGGIVDSLRVSDASNAFEVVTGQGTAVVDDPNLALSTVNPFSGTVIAFDAAPVTADIILDNTGATETLVIEGSSTITGDDAASYSILTALPLDIAPGETETLQVQFDPSGSGRISSATLTLSTNDESTSDFTIPLSARVLGEGGNQLLNGDFEDNPASPDNWLINGNATITQGIAPGSTSSVTLSPGVNFRQPVFAGPDWYLECFFQAPETFDRAFNVFVNTPAGNINLRFQGTSDGAEKTWNLFDNVTANDGWGAPIPLPDVQPGATYQLRIIGNAWDGVAPTYDIELSAPDRLALAGTATGLARFQNFIPSGAPTEIRFSSEFGNAPGFIIDDVFFANGSPPSREAPTISNLVFDSTAQTSTLTFLTQTGTTYSLKASNDLENWVELTNFTAVNEVESYTESGVTSPRRFYILEIVD
ncbi:MAG: hypothetical protein PVJ98_08235 [Akkermansiaceae bacterium]|jgi:hypothetical protein